MTVNICSDYLTYIERKIPENDSKYLFRVSGFNSQILQYCGIHKILLTKSETNKNLQNWNLPYLSFFMWIFYECRNAFWKVGEGKNNAGKYVGTIVNVMPYILNWSYVNKFMSFIYG